MVIVGTWDPKDRLGLDPFQMTELHLVSFRPLNGGYGTPYKWPYKWLINGGDPNYLQTRIHYIHHSPYYDPDKTGGSIPYIQQITGKPVRS